MLATHDAIKLRVVSTAVYDRVLYETAEALHNPMRHEQSFRTC